MVKDLPLSTLKKRLGANARIRRLPFDADSVPTLLQALKERWRMTEDNQAFHVVAAEYDRHFDEVTFLLDFSPGNEDDGS